ncbi:IPT/TIG domain-containing protein [Methanovulcanius yangii]|uniref:IPT/TIG domain-containing protein n=1 Tax=Methanovulcanius yangii TaxID=1789227 RepID=UPI0029CA78B8|nr:IPT/TIG domain-containing protein [Methanovulcanius yangii]
MTRKLLILALAITLFTLTGVMGVAAAGITGVSPAEGTLGTEVTITGSGFGGKTGEVLLGDEKCKVLDWSDTEITCEVFRPVPAGEYTITVLMQGDKKNPEPMTWFPFIMQKPQITEGSLTLDGDVVTIEGAFFGDKKGDTRLAYVDVGEGMEIEIEKGKIVDWSMDAISFRIPDDLTGRFILKVGNIIGEDYALMDLAGSPPLVGMDWPEGWGEYESCANARGFYYNDQLYVFSLWYSTTKIFSDEFYRIQVWRFKDGVLHSPYQLWEGTSYAEPAPLLVQYPNGGPEKMFVFVTGQNKNLYFTRLNGTDWEDGDWLKIQDHATGNYFTTKMNHWEVAPVYNPLNHYIYLYYAKDYDGPLYCVYSYDFGETWYDLGQVVGSPNVKSPPGAVFYAPDGNVRALVAVSDESQRIWLGKVSAAYVYESEILDTGNVENMGRPFLTDLGDGTIALVYGENHSPNAALNPDWYIPYIKKMNKTTGVWGESYQLYELPDLGTAQGTFSFHWQPNGAMYNDDFYLFYGFELTAWYSDDTNDGPWWKFKVADLGP